MAFYQLTYLQALYALKYGNLSVYRSLGRGDSTDTADTITGTLNQKGLDYSDVIQDESTIKFGSNVKFAGIEHFYDGALTFVDGIVTDENYNYLITDTNFNDNGNNYKLKFPIGRTAAFAGILEDCICTSEAGFAPTDITYGTSHVCFGSFASIDKSKIAMYGSGMFGLSCSMESTVSHDHHTGKLIKI